MDGYSPVWEAGSKDHARYLLGDTRSPYLLQTEEIVSALAGRRFEEGIEILALGLITRFGQEVSKYDEGSGATYEWKERVSAWKALAQAMRAELGRQEAAEIQAASAGFGGIEVGPLQMPTTLRLWF